MAQSNVLVTQGGGALPYKSYVAKLNQTGTSAPIATEIYNNTGGTFTYTRVAHGTYMVSSSNIDLSNAIVLTSVNTGYGAGIGSIDNAVIGTDYFSPYDAIVLQAIDIHNNITADNILYNNVIEIRVYNKSPLNTPSATP